MHNGVNRTSHELELISPFESRSGDYEACNILLFLKTAPLLRRAIVAGVRDAF